jgi:hypothetical protein
MAHMRRISIALIASSVLVLALPALAPATITEVGVLGETSPATVPSCPASCEVVSRTTGFQVKVGSARNLLSAPRNGTIVSWTINQGKPNATQIKFLETNEGGPAEAGIAVLAPQPKPNLTYKLVAQSPMVKLQPYFGETAQFPLETTIPIKKGYVVALTVPTWAPALALNFNDATSWRASRPRSGCRTTSAQSVQTVVGSAAQYYCLYQTARLTYSATEISTP